MFLNKNNVDPFSTISLLNMIILEHNQSASPVIGLLSSPTF